jgi:DNA-binding CsgD family transcriptional regulator/tetratricopeptide (TPR) repeat protein
MSRSRSWPGLRGRRGECERLSGLLAEVQAGHSQVLVLRGEAGIGKTALLEFLVDRAAACRVARAAGVESELELPFAVLHQLCSPYLDRAHVLPSPQQDALGTAFGRRPGGAPDRFLLGLAVLNLLCVVGEELPLVCVVDDAHWLDQASLQMLEFVARRLGAEPIAMVFAVRETDTESLLPGLPELLVRGLRNGDAAELLEQAVPWPLDRRVRDRVLADSHGNPLALTELPRELTATEIAFGGDEGSTPRPLVSRLEQGFRRQLGLLPPQSRHLLLAAASEPVGDVTVLWRAAEQLGIGADAASAAEAAGLIELNHRVRFRHPLVRTVAYRSATPEERRRVHRALADVTDPRIDPDRRAWHRAHAVVGTDETVADELDTAARREHSSGGLAAAAAFLGAAAALTPDRARRAQRSLDAAEVEATAGAFEEALSLLAVANAGPLDEAGAARIDLLQAQIAFTSGYRDEALPLLLAAARRWEPLDGKRARETYLEALSVAVSSGRLASGPASSPRHVAQVARAAAPSALPGKTDLLLDGMVALFTDGYAAAAPLVRRAVHAYGREELTMEEASHSAWLAAVMAADLWDDEHWDLLSQRHLEVIRRAGALGLLPLALMNRAIFDIHSGNLAAAASLLAERRWVIEVTGGEPRLTSMPEAWLAAMRGHEEVAEPLIQDTVDVALARGLGGSLTMMHAARAVLYNGRGRYEDAMAAAQEAVAEPLEVGSTKWALSELVEAGVRAGRADVARPAFAQLSAMTRCSGTELALGIEAGSRALLRDDDAAEDLYREAIERLDHTRIRVELARARLHYGEWLRRRGRRVDARTELRTACEAFSAMGVDAFADRARHELLATGETVRRRTPETAGDLTTQEAHIARLAADGLTNPEIGAQLYLSSRTVEWHLRKVFAKTGISTRRQLRRSLHA